MKFSLLLVVSLLILLSFRFEVVDLKLRTPGDIVVDFMKQNAFLRALESNYRTVRWRKKHVMNYTILVLTDRPRAELSVNLFLSSFARFKVRHYLFVGVGEGACARLTERGIRCVEYWEDSIDSVWDDPGAGQTARCESTDFVRTMEVKTDILLNALRTGHALIFLEPEVVFIKIITSSIERMLHSQYVVFLKDQFAGNMGFVAVRPMPYSIEVFSRLQSLVRVAEETNNQTALVDALETLDSSPLVEALDSDRYLSGRSYLERDIKGNSSADFAVNCPECWVVHNSWLESREAKVFRFKETLLWYVDDEGYYSDKTRKYLLFYNPKAAESRMFTDSHFGEIDALRAGLQIAAILNRTLILPRFHCELRSSCPFNALFDVDRFHNQFRPNYRESTFLMNRLVPDSISTRPRWKCISKSNETAIVDAHACNRQERNACVPFKPIPILIMIMRNSNVKVHPVSTALEEFPNSQILNLTSLRTLDEGVVRKHFGACSDQVLVLNSLTKIVVRFSEQRVEAAFKIRFDSGVVKDYFH